MYIKVYINMYIENYCGNGTYRGKCSVTELLPSFGIFV